MVLVDTSIWIALYRRREIAMGQTIWMLVARNEAAVSGQVWVEFLGGFRDGSTRAGYEEKLRAYPFLETTRAAYELAASLLAAHPRLGAGTRSSPPRQSLPMRRSGPPIAILKSSSPTVCAFTCSPWSESPFLYFATIRAAGRA